jgi:hypothetical protein
VPLPDTLADPTVVPPAVHETGGADCGPNTLKVSVPVGSAPPASAAEIEAAEIGLPAVALAHTVGLTGAALSNRPCV